MLNMMSYRYSYPLYLDVSDHHKQNQFNNNSRVHAYQREDNTSPTTALINLNAFYESMISNGHNTSSFLNARSHMASLPVPFNQYFNSQLNQPKKLTSDSNASKSSFSIEAILGINHRQNNNYLMVNEENEYDLNNIKFKANYKFANEISPKATNYIKANSIASVSPDSTAKEQNLIRYNQRGKNKMLSSNVITSQMNNNKRSIDCVEGSEIKPNKNVAKIDLSQRLVHNSIPQGKSKRVRTIFTPEQLEKLETEFERQQYMVGPERLYLASALNLSEAQVKVWFQNRRIKWRKQHLEMQHARFGKQCHNSEMSGEITTDDDGEQDGSSIGESRSYQTVHNDVEFLSQSPNSVDILH